LGRHQHRQGTTPRSWNTVAEARLFGTPWPVPMSTNEWWSISANAVLHGRPLRYSPGEAAQNMRVIEGLYRSARGQGRVVAIRD
jgi:hypothetical protein